MTVVYFIVSCTALFFAGYFAGICRGVHPRQTDDNVRSAERRRATAPPDPTDAEKRDREILEEIENYDGIIIR